MSRKALRLAQHLAPAGIVLASAAAALGFSGCAGDDDALGTCVSTEQYFAERIQGPIISAKCIACHTANGAAKASKMVLKGSSEAGFISENLRIIQEVASFERDGESLFLLKPTGTIEHGGGLQVVKGGTEYAAMKGLLARFDHPVDCQTNVNSFFADVRMLDWGLTARKTALTLAGRLPTVEEAASVEAGGEEAFDALLGTLMNEEIFYDRLKQFYNDQFLTDQYLLDNALQVLPDGGDDGPSYYNPFWFDNAGYDPTLASKMGVTNENDFRDRLEEATQLGVAREPVELIAYVVKNNLPFTEILTAPYTVVNPFSAKAYGMTDVQFQNDADPNEFVVGYFGGYDGKFPHAGVLTSPIMLIRHPTTPTNVNRHRARMVYQYFLGTDILKTAEQPLDPTKITDFNPTMNNPACTVCHDQIDPMAGAFHSFDEQARFIPGDTWIETMRPPGFGSAQIPYEQFDTSIQWLAAQVSADPRFALAAVFIMYEGITGQKPLIAPKDTKEPGFKEAFSSYLAQYHTFNAIAKSFQESNYNLKVVVAGIVKSPYFRAINANVASEDRKAQLGDLGMGQFNIPEQLHRKILAITGYPWQGHLTLNRDYHILYGGIDSRDVITRPRDPNGVMANIADRMANEMSCLSVPRDFALPQDQRRYFPFVDPTFEPKDANGFDVVPAVAAIKQNIVHLHGYLLGEHLELDDPEIERTYQLFAALYDDGQKGMADPALNYGTSLPWPCQVHKDFWTVEAVGWEAAPDLPEDQKITQDPNYAIRAWMGVVTYMLTDYAFLYE